MKNTNATASKKILYDSLCTAEIENLNEACMNAIEGKRKDVSLNGKVLRFFRDVCFCGDTFKIDLSVNESLFSVVSYLENNAWNIKRIFINPESEEDARNCAKLIEMNEGINYTEVHPNSVAMGFRMYVEKNLKAIIPANVTRRLIRAYENEDVEAKNKILPRIPFILNDSHRLFLKSLKKVFHAIKTSSRKNEIDVDKLYDIFAPIVIRRPDDMLSTEGRILKSILMDLMDADFDEFPMSFYSY